MNQSDEAEQLLDTVYGLIYSSKMPKIKKTPNGKPYFPDRLDIHFSLSHSKTHILCGLSSTPIGVDIESPREINDRTLDFFSTPVELEYFHPLELWVLKESYIKLFGKTLTDVKNLHFTRLGEKIISPDKSVKSYLLQIDSCYAAVSFIGEETEISTVRV